MHAPLTHLLPRLLTVLLLALQAPLSHASDPVAQSNLAGLRADLSAVVQALHYRLTGTDRETIGVVHFSKEAGSLKTEGMPDLSGFILKRTLITSDEALNENAIHRRMTGMLQLRDAIGRIALIDVAAVYLMGDRTVLVQNAVATPHYAGRPSVRLLIVPAARLPSLRSLERFPFDELYRLFAENALAPSELTAADNRPLMLGLFDLVRQEPGSIIRLYAGDSRGSFDKRDDILIEDKGWSAQILQGRFGVGASGSVVLHAVHQGPSTDKRIAGSFEIQP